MTDTERELNFIKRLCDKSYYEGRSWAYDDALFLLNLYGDNIERVKQELKARIDSAKERKKQCLL